MDSALLLDLGVAIATALCVALLAYGIWLCLPDGGPEAEKKGDEEAARAEPTGGAPKAGEL